MYDSHKNGKISKKELISLFQSADKIEGSPPPKELEGKSLMARKKIIAEIYSNKADDILESYSSDDFLTLPHFIDWFNV